MQLLITILIWCVVFAVLAFALLWVCTRFFPEFPPARWICGVILLIVLLVVISQQFGGSFPHPMLR